MNLNQTFFRIICDKCGRQTLTANIMDNSSLVQRDVNGEDYYLRLCPEHMAEYQRLISDFLSSVIHELR